MTEDDLIYIYSMVKKETRALILQIQNCVYFHGRDVTFLIIIFKTEEEYFLLLLTLNITKRDCRMKNKP